MEILAKQLKLTIQREDFEDTGTEEMVRISLEDDLAMSKVEICYSVSQSQNQSRKYHLKEAIIIALRRLIDEAVNQEMIKISVFRGESTRSNTPSSASTRGVARPTTS